MKLHIDLAYLDSVYEHTCFGRLMQIILYKLE